MEAEDLASTGSPDQLRSIWLTTSRRPAETPVEETRSAPPAPSTGDRAAAAAKSGKRKFVLLGIVALLALAGAGYGRHYPLVGRFYVSTTTPMSVPTTPCWRA